MRVTMLLADFAEAVNGKLYIMGGGWSMTGPGPSPSAIALKIDVPWDEANKKHHLKLELVDADDRPVVIPTPAGDSSVQIESDFEIGRPVGLKPGTPLDMPLAINVPPLPLRPDTRFVWRLHIDGHTQEDWQVSFTTRSVPPGGSPLQSAGT